MKRLRKHRGFLQTLQNVNPKQRKTILKLADKQQINCICEVCKNLLQGNVPISSSQKNKLKKYRNVLHKLSTRNTPLYKRRRLLTQTGGFLPALLTPLLSLLGSILGNG